MSLNPVTITHNTTWFEARVRHVSLQMPGVASALAKRATFLLAREVIQGGMFGPGTPVATGAARSSWTLMPSGEGSPKPFTPGRAPDLDGAAALALVRQTAMETAPNVTYFVLASACPYMIPLEYGHSQRQAPDGMIRTALAGWPAIVKQAAEDVRRSGLGGDPFGGPDMTEGGAEGGDGGE